MTVTKNTQTQKDNMKGHGKKWTKIVRLVWVVRIGKTYTSDNK